MHPRTLTSQKSGQQYRLTRPPAPDGGTTYQIHTDSGNLIAEVSREWSYAVKTFRSRKSGTLCQNWSVVLHSPYPRSLVGHYHLFDTACTNAIEKYEARLTYRIVHLLEHTPV